MRETLLEPTPEDQTDVVWPSVAVYVLNWNGRFLLESCLPPLLNQTYPNLEIVVIDNGSDDDSVPFVQANFPQVTLICHAENLGFSKGHNVALAQQSADYFVLLNNDVLVEPTCVESLIRPLHTDPQIGIVGGKLLFPDGNIQHIGAELSYPQAFGQHHHVHEPDDGQLTAMRDVDYVTGAAIAFPRHLWQEVGGFDIQFSPYYFEEVDLCYRTRAAGYRVVVVPHLLGIHDESSSMQGIVVKKIVAFHHNRLRFVLKHYSTAAFLTDFVPAETIYLTQPIPAEHIQALRRVYLKLAVAYPNTAVQKALLTLHQTVLQQTAVSPQKSEPLTEFDFGNNGNPIIAKIRHWWSQVATKWMVRYLTQQQTAVNYQLQQQINALQQQQISNEQELRFLLESFIARQQNESELGAPDASMSMVDDGVAKDIAELK